MTFRNQYIAGVVTLALIGAVSALCWVDKINGEATIGFLASISTLVLGGAVASVAHKQGAEAALSVPEQKNPPTG